MANTDTAKSTFLLDGQQAVSEMDKLIAKSKELKAIRERAAAVNDLTGFKAADDALKANEKTLRSYKKAVFDTDAVLKNLNGSTLKDLEQAARTITERMKTMTRGTEEWKKSSADLGAVKQEIAGVKNEMSSAGDKTSGFSSAWKVLGSVTASVTAILGSAYGAISFGKSIIASSESLSDRWAKTTQGLTNAWNVFKNAIATADFSNLISNMKDAIAIGEEYAEIMDQIEDRTRGVSVAESKAQLKLSKLRIKMNDVNLTPKGRAAYGEEIKKTELELAAIKEGIAKDEYDATFKNVAATMKLNEASVKEFIEFKGNTEEKVKLADEYNQRVRDLEALNKTVVTQYGTEVAKTADQKKEIKKLQNQIRGTSSDIVDMANVLNKLSPESIKELTRVTTGYYGAQAAGSQAIENVQKKQDKLEKAEEKAMEVKKTKMEEFTQRVNEAREKIEDLKLANQPVPQSLIDDFVNKSNALFVINEDIENLTKNTKELEFDWSELDKAFDDESFKAVREEAVALANDIWDTVIPATNELAEAEQDKFDAKLKREEEWKQTAYDSARTVSDAIFSITAQNDQAIFDQKMSLLERQKQTELSNKNLTEKQKVAIEDKYNKQAAELKAKAWKKQRAADIIQNIINTALAVTASLTSVPPNPALAIAAGIQGAASTAIIASQPMPEFAGGRYNVQGQSGRRYNASYAGPAVTGLYTSPAIVAEQGSEMIIDHPTTRNLQLNFPGVLEAINAARVPQFASGRYPSGGSASSSVSLQDGGFVSAVQQFSNAVTIMQQYGVKATISLYDLERMQGKRDNLEASVNM